MIYSGRWDAARTDDRRRTRQKKIAIKPNECVLYNKRISGYKKNNMTITTAKKEIYEFQTPKMQK